MPGDAAPTVFFDKTYEETVGLLVEMRDYVAHDQPQDRLALPPTASARLCCESFRVTARLTQIMAWLLAQKAVHAGEISVADIVEQYDPLAQITICMEDEPAEQLGGLPPSILQLLDRSRRLYIRVARLDEMVRRQLH